MILKIKGVYANRIWPLLIPSVFCLSCSLFDDSLLDQQRAEIVRLKKEAETLRQETAALQTKKQKSDREKESCNAAFEDFESARGVPKPSAKIKKYMTGLEKCPNDDVARYELAQIYLSVSESDLAKSQLEEALRINPNFTRAIKQLESID